MTVNHIDITNFFFFFSSLCDYLIAHTAASWLDATGHAPCGGDLQRQAQERQGLHNRLAAGQVMSDKYLI